MLLQKCLFIATIMVSSSKAGYVLQLELKSFSNPSNTLASGQCCDEGTSSVSMTCTEACDVVFVFCWKNYNSVSTSIAANTCKSRGSTSVYEDRDHINFLTGPFLSIVLSNPIVMRGDVWPGGIQMFVRVVDIDNGSERSLIDHFRLRESLTPGTITHYTQYSGVQSNATLVARFSLTCSENFYQPNCSVFCMPQDGAGFGHYECAPRTGEKVCRLGYTNPTSNCTKCATAIGCSSQGYCDKPFECICRAGYGGTLCEQDLDVCGHSRPCLRGSCTNTGPNSHHCECPEGFYGRHCQFYENQVSCSQSPCQNGRTCTSTGPDSHYCLCKTGYQGFNCMDDMNVCGHISPCLNGATCINTGANAYTCQCASSYNGTNCDIHTGHSVSGVDIPRVPVIAGCVVGCLVLLAIVVCLLVYIKKKGCLSWHSKNAIEQATSHVYLSGSENDPASPISPTTPSQLQISPRITEYNHGANEPQHRFNNPLSTEADHYYSTADQPQRYETPVHLYSTPHRPEKNSDREPYYTTVNGHEGEALSNPPQCRSRAQTTNRNQQQHISCRPAEIDDYCEPADAVNVSRELPLYHVLENGPPDTSSAGPVFGSPPPLYQVLEEPPMPIKAPISSGYMAEMSSEQASPALPDYETIDDEGKDTTTYI